MTTRAKSLVVYLKVSPYYEAKYVVTSARTRFTFKRHQVDINALPV